MANKARLYKLKSGETLVSLAKRYKYKSWKQIWQDSENKSIVKKRGKPEKLQAGDSIYMPVTEEERKHVNQTILKQNLKRNQELEIQEYIKERTSHLRYTSKILRGYVVEINALCLQMIKDINEARSGIKKWSQGVDIAATLINMSRSLKKIGEKALKSSKLPADELKNLNEEIVKDLQKEILKKNFDTARKGLTALKGTSLEAVSIINDSYDKISSPSFWAMTLVQKFGEGKSWSDSVTYDVDEDMNNRISNVERERKRLVGDINAEISRQEKTIENLKGEMNKSQKRAKQIEDSSIKLMDSIR